MIYSATACIDAEPLDSASPVVRQMIYAIVGLGAMFTLAFVDFRHYGHFQWAIWIGTLLILSAVVLAACWPSDRNCATRRWRRSSPAQSRAGP